MCFTGIILVLKYISEIKKCLLTYFLIERKIRKDYTLGEIELDLSSPLVDNIEILNSCQEEETSITVSSYRHPGSFYVGKFIL